MLENANFLMGKEYCLEYNQDGVFLTVLPKAEYGTTVIVEDVLDYIERKQVKNFDRDVVSKTVMECDGIPHKIAEAQEEEKVDAIVKVKLSSDKMNASIEIIPPEGGRMLTAEEIIQLLAQEGIIFGLDLDAIEAVSKFPIYNQSIIVAKGEAPVHGENGKMKYHFKIAKNRTPKILEDGRVDFYELDLIDNVHARDVLVSAIPPTTGKSGYDVLGQEIPAVPGKPVVLPKGKNVELSKDGQQLIASVDGNVDIKDKKVNVYALYEVDGDVDPSVGNIDFVGNVIVKGNVRTGFSIKSGGTVEIQGVVEGAAIEADGDIILRGGMQGVGRGILKSNGNIVAKFIENGTLIANGNIKSEAIMHSTLFCKGKLEVGGKKGIIVGGTVKVGEEISAKVIGSPMATVTELEVGLDPSIRERYKALKNKVTNIEIELRRADQAVQLLKKLEDLNKLDEGKRVLMLKSMRTRIFMSNQLNDLRKELLEIEEILEKEQNGKIKVLDIIYPGTKISIGSCLMYVKEDIKYATIYRDRADIRIGPYLC